MDEATAAFYEAQAATQADLYERGEGAAKYFALAFASGARVLDVGAGSGRDAARLADAGHEVYGLEPSTALREVALVRHPGLRGRLLAGALPDAVPEPAALGGPFDGLLCSAVLQHVPRAALFDALFRLRGLLKPGGRALVSIPIPPADVGAGDRRDEGGRLYTHLVPDELQLLFERVGFTTIGAWRDPDSLGRPLVWATFLFTALATAGGRPIDLVESVLSQRERKVSTYKLALFRALCELATSQARSVRWRGDGLVAVPIDEIARRWIRYYWPLLSRSGAEKFLPQMNGEWADRSHNLSFAKPLHQLIEGYARSGKFTTYVLQERSAAIPKELASIHGRLLAKVRDAIKDGPVKHAGGKNPIFKHDGKHVLVPAELWRELCLMGHWIHDALLVRWADLTVRLSSQALTRETVLEALLTESDPRRETDVARRPFVEVKDLRCVWTDSPLNGKSFDVDHVIPFALWRNNDLWNLLPCSSRANNAKSDSLPTRALLWKRQSSVLACWDVAHAAHEVRFSREAAAFTGTTDPSLHELFGALVESVEVTAVQHGVRPEDRWAG